MKIYFINSIIGRNETWKDSLYKKLLDDGCVYQVRVRVRIRVRVMLLQLQLQ